MGTRLRIKDKLFREAMEVEQRKVDVRQELLKSIVSERGVSYREAKVILTKNLEEVRKKLEEGRKKTFWSNVKDAIRESENQ